MAATAAPRAPSPLVTLQQVGSSSTADLIAAVAPDLIAAVALQTGQPKRSGLVGPLLERFDRCGKELAKLQQQIDLRAERLRGEVGTEEGEHQARVAGLEAEWRSLRTGFGTLEGRMTGVTQAATKTGNRLQTADLYRRRALEAIEQIKCLLQFAHAGDSADLPPLFHDNTRLAEAAAMASKLTTVVQELLNARERASGPGDAGTPHSAAPEVGTLERAAEQLELYRSLLDGRVVSAFDAALARQDLRAMAQCCGIMAEFSRGEDILVQRYISTRPMFTNLRELQFAAQQQQHAAAAAASSSGAALGSAGAPDAELAAADQAALRGLSSLYKSILTAVRDEAVVIEQVFPSPYRALGLYIQRVFEQKVQTAVDAVLPPPPPAGAAHAAVHAWLRKLAEVYRRTRGLADDLQELCGGGSAITGAGSADAPGLPPHVRDLADMACSPGLVGHLPTELRWLQGAYEQHAAAQRASGRGLCMEGVLELLAMNEEAVSRCALLSSPAQLATSVRQLFQGSGRSQAGSSCLLEQVAAHILSGLGSVMDACGKALQGPFRPQHHLDAAVSAAQAGSPGAPASGPAPAAAAGQLPPQQQQQQQHAGAACTGAAAAAGSPGAASMSRQLSRQTLERAAQLAVAASMERVLQAVSTVGAIVTSLQQHYQRAVAPHLVGSSSEARACVAGLAALVRVADERLLSILQRCLTLLLGQADATLAAEQQRSDFCPGEAAAPPNLDAPTPACATVCALLSAAVGAAERHLHGPNLASFLAELGRRTCSMLDAHMQRFSFNALGALRWKRDLADYAALVAGTRSPAARRHMEDMQAGVAMLIVAPGSLLTLVDGSLRISHRTALSTIQLREDFRTARVGQAGATLASLFTSE